MASAISSSQHWLISHEAFGKWNFQHKPSSITPQTTPSTIENQEEQQKSTYTVGNEECQRR
jgi:hypothetical protein